MARTKNLEPSKMQIEYVVNHRTDNIHNLVEDTGLTQEQVENILKGAPTEGPSVNLFGRSTTKDGKPRGAVSTGAASQMADELKKKPTNKPDYITTCKPEPKK